jgi:hypothetical protein
MKKIALFGRLFFISVLGLGNPEISSRADVHSTLYWKKECWKWIALVSHLMQS